MTGDQLVTITLIPARLDQLQARAEERGITVLEQIDRALDHEATCRQDKLIPANASVGPRHWFCRLLGHRELRYREASELTDGVTTAWIAEATCLSCGRPQPNVRVRFPRNYTLCVVGPPTEEATRKADGRGPEAAR